MRIYSTNILLTNTKRVSKSQLLSKWCRLYFVPVAMYKSMWRQRLQLSAPAFHWTATQLAQRLHTHWNRKTNNSCRRIAKRKCRSIVTTNRNMLIFNNKITLSFDRYCMTCGHMVVYWFVWFEVVHYPFAYKYICVFWFSETTTYRKMLGWWTHSKVVTSLDSIRSARASRRPRSTTFMATRSN